MAESIAAGLSKLLAVLDWMPPTDLRLARITISASETNLVARKLNACSKSRTTVPLDIHHTQLASMEQPPHAPPKLNEDILHQIFQHCDKDTAVAFSFVNKATLAVATSRFRAQLSPLDIVLHVRYPDRAYLRKKYLRASQPGEVKTGTRWDIATEEELDWICWRKRDLNVITFE